MAGFAVFPRGRPSNLLTFALHPVRSATALNRSASLRHWPLALVETTRSCTALGKPAADFPHELGIPRLSSEAPLAPGSSGECASVGTGAEFPLLLNGFLAEPNWGSNR
jgi:hypothetical protein